MEVSEKLEGNHMREAKIFDMLLLQFCSGQPISDFQEEKNLCSHFIYAITMCLVCKLCHSFHIHTSSIHPLINVHPKRTLQQLQAKIDENYGKNNREIL